MKGRARAIALLVAGLLALGLAAWAIWGVFIRPGQKAEQAVQATAAAGQAGTQVKAAADAAVITDRYVERVREIERVRDEGNAAIAAAPGADEPLAPDVYRALVAALCVRHDRAGDPACQRMQHDGGADAAPADAPGADPAQ